VSSRQGHSVSPAPEPENGVYADTIVAHTKGIAGMKAYRDDVRARMAACKVLFLVAPIIGETANEARAVPDFATFMDTRFSDELSHAA
jgi:hypothetical protein